MEFDALKKVMANILGMDPNEVKMDMTFLNDLGADSLDLFQIIMGLEEAFDIWLQSQPTSMNQPVKKMTFGQIGWK